jgi:predicted MFS family arabinose efflux permease
MWRAFNPFSLLAGAAVYGLGFSGLVPIFLSLAITHAPDERRGAATATYYTAFDLGIAVGATAMGPVAEAFGYRAVFGSCMGIALVALLILIRMLPLLRPNTGGVPGPNPS